MKKFWRNYNLSIVLAILFFLSWGSQFAVQVKKVSQEAEEHGKEFSWGDVGTEFWASTLENWQSEFLQLLTFVVLTSFLIHKNSHESKDSDERIEAKLDSIIRLLSKSDKKE